MNRTKINLEEFYTIINKDILLLEKYTEIENLSNIIKSCRLKPLKIFNDKKIPTKKGILYDTWFDEFKSSIKLLKNKTFKITFNDLTIDHDQCTDFYYGLNINNISKISKLVYLYIAKDEDTNKKVYFISFLGIDNYLRSYLYNDNWIQVSSLMLGLYNLKFIFKNLDIKYFKKLAKKNNIKIPCHAGEAWLSCLPTNEKFIGELENLHGADFSFLNNKKGIDK